MKSGVLIVAIILIAIGVVSLAYQGITYTTREKVLEVGPIKATAEKERTIPLPPILGRARAGRRRRPARGGSPPVARRPDVDGAGEGSAYAHRRGPSAAPVVFLRPAPRGIIRNSHDEGASC
jgi:hypothetical protein